MSNCHCSACGRSEADPREASAIEGKAAGCLAGLTLGARSQDPWIMLGLALMGTAVGHWIDTEVSPRCPQCGAALRAVLASFRH